MLNASPAIYKHRRSTSKILFVLMPDAPPYFQSTQMHYIKKQFEIASFTKNEWAEPPAQMLLPLMANAIQNANYYRAIITSPIKGHYDYILSSRIEAMQQDFTKSPSVYEFVLRVQLTNASSNTTIKSKVIKVAIPVRGSSLYDSVLAANAAVSVALRELVIFSTKN